MIMTHIPDEAVQAAKKAVFERCKKTYLTDDQMFAALTSALPHLSAPCAVDEEDMKAVSRMAARADDYDTADENGEWPDFQDVMATLGEVRALRRILSCVVTKPVDQDAKDFEAIGRAYMATFETVTSENSEWSGYTPSECPSELLLDIYAAQQEAKPVDVAAVRRQAEHAHAMYSSLVTIVSLLGNVDHSIGNGANSARMRGELLNEIKAIAERALSDEPAQ